MYIIISFISDILSKKKKTPTIEITTSRTYAERQAIVKTHHTLFNSQTKSDFLWRQPQAL